MKIISQNSLLKFFTSIVLLTLIQNTYATAKFAPQPTSCIIGTFNSVTSTGWASESLTLTNRCAIPVNFQNSTITFTNKTALNTGFWGDFSPLSYPTGSLQITSQLLSSGDYKASINLNFATGSWVTTILPVGRSFTIQYGETAAGYNASSLQVWLASPIATGEIDLSNNSAKPTDVTTAAATINLVSGGQTTVVKLPWQGQIQMTGLTPGNYIIQPENVTDTLGNVYQGNATPSNIVLSANQKILSTITYNPITILGSINIQAALLPTAISGYTGTPVVTLMRKDTGAALTQNLSWGTLTSINQLANNISYTLSAPIISYNSYNCTANFSPGAVVSSASAPATAILSYACVPMIQDKVTFNLSGLPTTVNTVTVTLIPNDGSAQINQPISVSNGTGSGSINLSDGVTYTVVATTITGYITTFSPQPLTAKINGIETIIWQKQTSTGGRVMTYIPGWKIPPPAADLATAGYTHVLIAFGVFSTTTPGQIVSAFDTVNKSYIDSLHAVGIKVLLSLGGASTSIANTSVIFHNVLALASSPQVFQQTFIQSIKNLVTQYGFDGIDIDVEQGLTTGGTFTNPTGDIAIMANIINQLHADNPALLISLAPQIANIAATNQFTEIWGNYAALIMQTHNALNWVGIQMYNSGCAFGIDQICYDPNNNTKPDASVAMAADLLTNWPATLPDGRASRFQPYISYLSPSQIVLGYPAANSTGTSDGAPAANIPTIKRSIQCLTTGIAGPNSCNSYIPPKTYPDFGGVFNWEATYDQSNNYAFAKGLSACVKQGNCQ